MIKKAKFMCVFAAGGLLCANFTMADSVVVKGDVLFYTSPGYLNIALVPGGNLPSSCSDKIILPLSIDVAGATAVSDIAISGENAFVRTADDTVPPVHIPECLTEAFHSVGDCIAVANLDTGRLTVPCVDVENDGIDNIYEANFERRGNSSNWEVISSPLNEKFKPRKQ
jgi:hypothetical protein